MAVRIARNNEELMTQNNVIYSEFSNHFNTIDDINNFGGIGGGGSGGGTYVQPTITPTTELIPIPSMMPTVAPDPTIAPTTKPSPIPTLAPTIYPEPIIPIPEPVISYILDKDKDDWDPFNSYYIPESNKYVEYDLNIKQFKTFESLEYASAYWESFLNNTAYNEIKLKPLEQKPSNKLWNFYSYSIDNSYISKMYDKMYNDFLEVRHFNEQSNNILKRFSQYTDNEDHVKIVFYDLKTFSERNDGFSLDINNQLLEDEINFVNIIDEQPSYSVGELFIDVKYNKIQNLDYYVTTTNNVHLDSGGKIYFNNSEVSYITAYLSSNPKIYTTVAIKPSSIRQIGEIEINKDFDKNIELTLSSNNTKYYRTMYFGIPPFDKNDYFSKSITLYNEEWNFISNSNKEFVKNDYYVDIYYVVNGYKHKCVGIEKETNLYSSSISSRLYVKCSTNIIDKNHLQLNFTALGQTARQFSNDNSGYYIFDIYKQKRASNNKLIFDGDNRVRDLDWEQLSDIRIKFKYLSYLPTGALRGKYYFNNDLEFSDENGKIVFDSQNLTQNGVYKITAGDIKINYMYIIPANKTTSFAIVPKICRKSDTEYLMMATGRGAYIIKYSMIYDNESIEFEKKIVISEYKEYATSSENVISPNKTFNENCWTKIEIKYDNNGNFAIPTTVFAQYNEFDINSRREAGKDVIAKSSIKFIGSKITIDKEHQGAFITIYIKTDIVADRSLPLRIYWSNPDNSVFYIDVDNRSRMRISLFSMLGLIDDYTEYGEYLEQELYAINKVNKLDGFVKISLSLADKKWSPDIIKQINPIARVTPEIMSIQNQYAAKLSSIQVSKIESISKEHKNNLQLKEVLIKDYLSTQKLEPINTENLDKIKLSLVNDDTDVLSLWNVVPNIETNNPVVYYTLEEHRNLIRKGCKYTTTEKNYDLVIDNNVKFDTEESDVTLNVVISNDDQIDITFTFERIIVIENGLKKEKYLINTDSLFVGGKIDNKIAEAKYIYNCVLDKTTSKVIPDLSKDSFNIVLSARNSTKRVSLTFTLPEYYEVTDNIVIEQSDYYTNSQINRIPLRVINDDTKFNKSNINISDLFSSRYNYGTSLITKDIGENNNVVFNKTIQNSEKIITVNDLKTKIEDSNYIVIGNILENKDQTSVELKDCKIELTYVGKKEYIKLNKIIEYNTDKNSIINRIGDLYVDTTDAKGNLTKTKFTSNINNLTTFDKLYFEKTIPDGIITQYVSKDIIENKIYGNSNVNKLNILEDYDYNICLRTQTTVNDNNDYYTHIKTNKFNVRILVKNKWILIVNNQSIYKPFTFNYKKLKDKYGHILALSILDSNNLLIRTYEINTSFFPYTKSTIVLERIHNTPLYFFNDALSEYKENGDYDNLLPSFLFYRNNKNEILSISKITEDFSSHIGRFGALHNCDNKVIRATQNLTLSIVDNKIPAIKYYNADNLFDSQNKKLLNDYTLINKQNTSAKAELKLDKPVLLNYVNYTLPNEIYYPNSLKYIGYQMYYYNMLYLKDLGWNVNIDDSEDMVYYMISLDKLKNEHGNFIEFKKGLFDNGNTKYGNNLESIKISDDDYTIDSIDYIEYYDKYKDSILEYWNKRIKAYDIIEEVLNQYNPTLTTVEQIDAYLKIVDDNGEKRDRIYKILTNDISVKEGDITTNWAISALDNRIYKHDAIYFIWKNVFYELFNDLFDFDLINDAILNDIYNYGLYPEIYIPEIDESEYGGYTNYYVNADGKIEKLTKSIKIINNPNGEYVKIENIDECIIIDNEKRYDKINDNYVKNINGNYFEYETGKYVELTNDNRFTLSSYNFDKNKPYYDVCDPHIHNYVLDENNLIVGISVDYDEKQFINNTWRATKPSNHPEWQNFVIVKPEDKAIEQLDGEWGILMNYSSVYHLTINGKLKKSRLNGKQILHKKYYSKGNQYLTIERQLNDKEYNIIHRHIVYTGKDNDLYWLNNSKTALIKTHKRSLITGIRIQKMLIELMISELQKTINMISCIKTFYKINDTIKNCKETWKEILNSKGIRDIPKDIVIYYPLQDFNLNRFNFEKNCIYPEETFISGTLAYTFNYYSFDEHVIKDEVGYDTLKIDLPVVQGKTKIIHEQQIFDDYFSLSINVPQNNGVYRKGIQFYNKAELIKSNEDVIEKFYTNDKKLFNGIKLNDGTTLLEASKLIIPINNELSSSTKIQIAYTEVLKDKIENKTENKTEYTNKYLKDNIGENTYFVWIEPDKSTGIEPFGIWPWNINKILDNITYSYISVPTMWSTDDVDLSGLPNYANYDHISRYIDIDADGSRNTQVIINKILSKELSNAPATELCYNYYPTEIYKIDSYNTTGIELFTLSYVTEYSYNTTYTNNVKTLSNETRKRNEIKQSITNITQSDLINYPRTFVSETINNNNDNNYQNYTSYITYTYSYVLPSLLYKFSYSTYTSDYKYVVVEYDETHKELIRVDLAVDNNTSQGRSRMMKTARYTGGSSGFYSNNMGGMYEGSSYGGMDNMVVSGPIYDDINGGMIDNGGSPVRVTVESLESSGVSVEKTTNGMIYHSIMANDEYVEYDCTIRITTNADYDDIHILSGSSNVIPTQLVGVYDIPNVRADLYVVIGDDKNVEIAKPTGYPTETQPDIPDPSEDPKPEYITLKVISDIMVCTSVTQNGQGYIINGDTEKIIKYDDKNNETSNNIHIAGVRNCEIKITCKNYNGCTASTPAGTSCKDPIKETYFTTDKITETGGYDINGKTLLDINVLDWINVKSDITIEIKKIPQNIEDPLIPYKEQLCLFTKIKWIKVKNDANNFINDLKNIYSCSEDYEIDNNERSNYIGDIVNTYCLNTTDTIEDVVNRYINANIQLGNKHQVVFYINEPITKTVINNNPERINKKQKVLQPIRDKYGFFLGSVSQWQIVQDNVRVINQNLALCYELNTYIYNNTTYYLPEPDYFYEGRYDDYKLSNRLFWTSSEINKKDAWTMFFDQYYDGLNNKMTSAYIRPFLSIKQENCYIYEMKKPED